MKERADLGFADALDDFNPADWQPEKPKVANDPARKEAAGQAAKAAGFKSREPKADAAPAAKLAAAIEAPAAAPAGQGAVRRRRTGRNAQFNLKARPETIEAFCAIADRQGWGLGETLEKAVSLLEKEYRA